MLPSGLQTLTSGLSSVTLSSFLQSATFGFRFNQSLQGVTLLRSLQTLAFGDCFHQPGYLWQRFVQSFRDVTLPSSLQTLTLATVLQSRRVACGR